MTEKHEIRKLKVHSDYRGWLAEILRREHLKNKKFGQIYVTTARTGMIKANHYHKRKTEWFCVIKGKAKLAIRRLNDKTSHEIIMGDDNLVVVKIPPKMIHGIKNIGKGMMYLLCYVDEPYNKDDPDTFVEEIISKAP